MRGKGGRVVRDDPSISEAGGLTHMEREPKEKHDELTQPSGPDYGSGLQLHLDHHDLTKLGHHDHPHEAGKEVHIHAKGHISHVSSEERDGKKEQRLILQITHLGIHHEADGFKGEDQKSGASPHRKRH